MIIDSDSHPEINIYYIGAMLLTIVRSSRRNKFELFYLLSKYNKKNVKNISFDYLLLSLTWLYTLGLIEVDNNGYISKCF